MVKIMKESDVWALGITIFTMIYQKLPFYDSNIIKLFKKIEEEKLKFPKKPKINKDLKNLIEGMLTKDPHKRLNIN